MHILCNAYWLDTSTLQGCGLLKIKEPTSGFNQIANVAATLSPPRHRIITRTKKRNQGKLRNARDYYNSVEKSAGREDRILDKADEKTDAGSGVAEIGEKEDQKKS
tara:strand:+ start:286 stop:603 length:318 start_codon:yes stop_codon:yes gene_type:complete